MTSQRTKFVLADMIYKYGQFGAFFFFFVIKGSNLKPRSNLDKRGRRTEKYSIKPGFHGTVE